MYTASLENCRKLFEVSGWDDGSLDDWREEPTAIEGTPKIAPKYDLGYLLRKLPLRVEIKDYTSGILVMHRWSDGSCVMEYIGGHKPGQQIFGPWASADTPEDAAAKLAIELFEQKILTPTTFNGGHDE